MDELKIYERKKEWNGILPSYLSTRQLLYSIQAEWCFVFFRIWLKESRWNPPFCIWLLFKLQKLKHTKDVWWLLLLIRRCKDALLEICTVKKQCWLAPFLWPRLWWKENYIWKRKNLLAWTHVKDIRPKWADITALASPHIFLFFRCKIGLPFPLFPFYTV